ncbi:hypothetical protein D1Y84_06040 [Acidipila sp. EB88]|nr:hypothetical protein D1Y84_06040 [Acidipila sp. EB88]
MQEARPGPKPQAGSLPGRQSPILDIPAPETIQQRTLLVSAQPPAARINITLPVLTDRSRGPRLFMQ